MQKMIFISRHAATQAQVEMAREAGYHLHHVGDVDAFDEYAVMSLIASHPDAAVCCVHPLIALAATVRCERAVGIFMNANRAPEGEKPSFEAVRLVLRFPTDCKFVAIDAALAE